MVKTVKILHKNEIIINIWHSSTVKSLDGLVYGFDV